MNKTSKKIHLRRKQIIVVLEQLEMYVSAGVPLDKALDSLSSGFSSKYKLTFLSVKEHILTGTPLSRALSGIIPVPIGVLGLIEHGESSGGLVDSLRLGRILMEKTDDLRNRCLSAMAYPTIIGVFALLMTIALIRGVVPQIIPMLTSLHADLPVLTRITIWLSDAMVSYGVYASIVILLIIFLFRYIYKQSLRMRLMIHRILEKVPLIGNLVSDYSWFIFLRSYGTLVLAGISSIDSYERSARHVPLCHVSDILIAQISSLRTGISLSIVFGQLHMRMPKHLVTMVSAGESSGRLGDSLIRSSEMIDRDLDHSLKRLTAFLEPTMMVAMGIVIGSVALSIMMPIYDITKVLQR